MPEDYGNLNEEPLEKNECYCSNCGNIINKKDVFCPFCGEKQTTEQKTYTRSSTPQPKTYIYPPKERVLYVLLALFLGCFCVHNFYAGHTNTAIKQLLISLLLGWLFGIGFFITFVWAIVDIIQVTHDGNGVPFS